MVRSNKYMSLIKEELGKLPDFVEQYYIGTNHAVTTIYQYLTEIRRFFAWLRQEGIVQAKSNREIQAQDLAHLRRNDIMLYIDYLRHSTNQQGRFNSPTTINRSLNALRSLFKFLTVTADNNNGKPYFERNVMEKISTLNDTQTLNYRAHVLESHMYTGQRKYDFIAYLQNQYEKECDPHAKPAFKHNKERDIAIIALILGTGVRVSEAANVNVKDLQLKNKSLDVTRKGGWRDTVPIAPWTIDLIKAYVDIRKKRYQPDKGETALFLTNYHGRTKRMTTNAIEKMVNKYSRAFGHPLTPHKLRHTLASELYAVTKDQVLVAQQLGQKGTSATDLYTHVDQSKQRNALREIGINDAEKSS